ncbi:hypothetical protein L596_028824 [Steinernema carpocapsae]|uniref:Uncharacterized protein n=1 Tax=Steinernema carpocapsae TaxID=34508 RepID=A0A4U5LZG5_STECR|nr:hypothetical protein L596_028824 [Steinernema carpocapsae]
MLLIILTLLLVLIQATHAVLPKCEAQHFIGHFLVGIKNGQIVYYQIKKDDEIVDAEQIDRKGYFKTVDVPVFAYKGQTPYKHVETPVFAVDWRYKQIQFYYRTNYSSSGLKDNQSWFQFGEVFFHPNGTAYPQFAHDSWIAGHEIHIFHTKDQKKVDLFSAYDYDPQTQAYRLTYLQKPSDQEYVESQHIYSKVYDYGTKQLLDRQDDGNRFTGVLNVRNGDKIVAYYPDHTKKDKIDYLAMINSKQCSFGTLPFPEFKYFYLLDLGNPIAKSFFDGPETGVDPKSKEQNEACNVDHIDVSFTCKNVENKVLEETCTVKLNGQSKLNVKLKTRTILEISSSKWIKK